MNVLLNKTDYMKFRGAGLGLMMILVISLITGCEKAGDSQNNSPSDHTVNKEGIMHKSGLTQPLTNCTGCHGSDLKGGTAGVSCFQCHNQKW
jgi:hypothetical protein